MKYVNLFFALLCISTLFLMGNRSGALPSNTGAPGELTCGRSVCHNIPANNGSGMVLIQLDEGLDTYTVADTHTISITLENSGTVRNGFQILALDANEDNVGEWIITAPELMQIINGFAPFQDRMYITHKEAGTNQSSWTFDWEAPEGNQGDITFYVSVNATNNNAQNTGDTLYTVSKTVTFNDPVATQELLRNDHFRLFPNPVKDWLQFDSQQSFPSTAVVYDNAGRTVRRYQIASHGQQLNMESLQPGIYTIVFEFAEGVLARKFVKY